MIFWIKNCNVDEFSLNLHVFNDFHRKISCFYCLYLPFELSLNCSWSVYVTDSQQHAPKTICFHFSVLELFWGDLIFRPDLTTLPLYRVWRKSTRTVQYIFKMCEQKIGRCGLNHMRVPHYHFSMYCIQYTHTHTHSKKEIPK